MSLVAQTPDHPTLSANVTALTAGNALDFKTTLNANIAAVEDKAQLVEAFLEELQAAIGQGALSGGTISAGTGLSASVTALKALVGSVVEFNATQAVALAASVTNSLFLRQDGTWTVNSTGAVPTDISTHGAYLLWGTATTNGSGVTGVTNTRRTFAQLLSRVPVVTADPAEAVDGDSWYRSDQDKMCVKVAGAVKRSTAFT